jgi:hypothetical protein
LRLEVEVFLKVQIVALGSRNLSISLLCFQEVFLPQNVPTAADEEEDFNLKPLYFCSAGQ